MYQVVAGPEALQEERLVDVWAVHSLLKISPHKTLIMQTVQVKALVH